MSIVVVNHQQSAKIHLPLLKQIAESLLVELGIKDAKLEINLVSAKDMTRLNEKFLQHKGPTDVITFNYAENKRAGFLQIAARSGAMRTSRPTLRGEVFICVEEAFLQAEEFRTNWQSEVVRYLVHGVLHLIGYDDLRLKERLKMKRAENRLLKQLSRRFSLAQLVGTAKLARCTNR